MSSFTIPADLHARMVRTFRHEYEDEFGSLDEVAAYSREQLAAKYARDIEFWKKRQPAIDPNRRPNMRTVCAHAIASNAIANMWKLCQEKGIESDVRLALGEVVEETASRVEEVGHDGASTTQ